MVTRATGDLLFRGGTPFLLGCPAAAAAVPLRDSLKAAVARSGFLVRR
jgi:hypothetical protein